MSRVWSVVIALVALLVGAVLGVLGTLLVLGILADPEEVLHAPGGDTSE